jgi:site-specific recombinase XerD
MKTMPKTKDLPALIEAFFMDRLIGQRQASPHTIAAYRDTFRLLLIYAHDCLNKPPSRLTLNDLEAPFVGGFLTYLEKKRGNNVRTRNLRLAAIHSFFHYVSYEQPEHSALIQRVLAIPSKKCAHALVGYLSTAEISAILDVPDRGAWSGRRDHALIAFAFQTGFRASELIGLSCQDITLGSSAQARCEGKGRKERCIPMDRNTARVMCAWLRERGGKPNDPVFPNARGARLSHDGLAYILSKHVVAAKKQCPSLKKKRVTPHVIRHSTAMNLLRSGVDCSMIALWLGHESVETTMIYLEADIEMKEKILAKTALPNTKPSRFHPDNRMLAFLNNL